MTNRLLVLLTKVGDPTRIERWAAEGHLPFIRSLMERGCHGRLSGPDRVCEHGSATTVFSGVPADRHGYYYFRQLVPGTYRLAKFSARDARAVPLWARPDGFAGEVALIDVPETAALPDVRGHQLVNWWRDHRTDLTSAIPASEPPALLDDLRARFGEPPDLLGDSANGTRDDDLRELDAFLASVRRKGDLCRHVASLGEPALVVAAFEEPHTASHRYWRYRPEAGNGVEPDERLRTAIRAVYQAVDREFERLTEQAGPDTNVVVLSLFGMQDQFPTEELNANLCRVLGFQVPRAGGAGRPRPLDVARRVLPERLRASISRRLPARRQEALLADLFASGTDWGRTTAFSLPSLYTGFIRVNLRGREPMGIVDPADYPRVLEEIEAELRRLVDADSGEPVIDSTVRAVDAFGSGPPSTLPDLFVEWRGSTRLLERVRHPRGELAQRRPAFCPGSEETVEGFFAAAGPDVTGRGGFGALASVDVAPTLLALLGRTPPSDWTGRPHPVVVGG